MNTSLYLPGDDLIDQALAEFAGYFWCRFHGGVVAGQRIVRFLMSPEQFEQARKDYGPGQVIPATGQEPIEQLAWKAIPAFHASLDDMAKVEARLQRAGMLWQIYLGQLRSALCLPLNVPPTPEGLFAMVTANARCRAVAAFLTIDAQRPKQQALFG